MNGENSMNIWDFEYQSNVKLTDTDGDVFVGTVIDIADVDENDNPEPIVALETQGHIYGFKESEILNMELINSQE